MRETKNVLKTLIVVFVFILAQVSISLAQSAFRTIDTTQLHSLVVDNAYRLEGGREKHCVVIDARSAKEYDEAHIFSAISIPEKDFESSKALLPSNKSVLLIVYGENADLETSRKWADKAAAAGYMNIAVYSEGFSAWRKNKMPIVAR